ncbi:penicillin acylase family protein [Hydrogenophaga sp. T2]|uniref:penicillin acylase family protein n=1 Tax=Hydrogenophaga sp. T2 TaxID=3132823 RepID=UPI003CF09B49
MKRPPTLPRPATLLPLVLAGALAACSSLPSGPSGTAGGSATIVRTAHGVPHITAPDLETLAFGVAYAQAQDNVCQTADHLLTVRGERSLFFGEKGTGILGVRTLPNPVIDAFVAAHMDDAALTRLWAASSPAGQAQARGYVAGYNRFLQDHAGKLPAACNGQPWVRPMALTDYYRATEAIQVQAGAGALADAILGAAPPKAEAAPARTGAAPAAPDAARLAEQVAGAQAYLREAGLFESPLGSNAWAFGKDTTANGRGMLLGNPHFPWVGPSRFYQMHLTVPGQFDVMGASIGLAALVQIGFNRDVAWSHTVSTGKRFTLHELALVPGQPTRYLLDGQPRDMVAKAVRYRVKGEDGQVSEKTHTVWNTHYGPVLAIPRAGLNWTAERAYALQDANAGGLRSTETYLGFARARSVDDLRQALGNLGTPWVNTIAADRHGQAFYADMSVVPDVDAAQLQRCAPSRAAAAVLPAAGLVVLDGSRSDCNWKKDPASPVPGLTPPARLAAVKRTDWVHNSNDSFFYTHPAVSWPAISPLVGDDVLRRPRTRSGLIEIPEMIGKGKVTLTGIQAQLFENRNLMARLVLPDLLEGCKALANPAADLREGCAALQAFARGGYRNDASARGAHLFREFWRTASTLPGVYRVPYDKARPVDTPSGLRLADAATAAKVWDALAGAVKKVRDAGFAPDAELGAVQRAVFSDAAIPVHGGDEIEGTLNNIGDRARPGISPRGLRIDYGTSYVQTVTFDERGPVAQALLTYGQSTNPASPHQTDQLRLYAAKQWPTLPFHPEDVARERVGEPLVLKR